MINEDLAELIKLRQKQIIDFDHLAYTKTLAGDVLAIRSPGIPEEYKLEALERIATKHFSYRRLFYRSRRDVLTDKINALSTEARNWLMVWLHDISIPEIYIALNSDDVTDTPVKNVFNKTRKLIRAAVEIELLGKTLDSKQPIYQEYDDERLYQGGKKQTTPAPFSIIIDRKTGSITHAGEELQKIPYKHFYTGQGLEDEIIERLAVKDIIAAVGASDIYYYITEDPPGRRDPDLQPPKDQWPLINAKNYFIKEKITAAAKRLGYYEG